MDRELGRNSFEVKPVVMIIRLVIDSVSDESIRVIISKGRKREELIVNPELLSKILTTRKFVEGRSYEITFDDKKDYDAFRKKKLVKALNERKSMAVKVKGQTRTDVERVKALQRQLGMRKREGAS